MANANPNAYSGLAEGLNQGLAIGQRRQAMAMEQQKMAMQMQMEQAKQTYDQISHNADQLGQILLNPKLPDSALPAVYNSWIQHLKVTNPDLAKTLPSVQDYTPQDGDIIKGAAQFLMSPQASTLDSSTKQAVLQQIFNQAQGKNTSPDFMNKFTQFAKANFGDSPQTLTNNGTNYSATVNQFGQANPITMAPAGQPFAPAGQATPQTPINIPPQTMAYQGGGTLAQRVVAANPQLAQQLQQPAQAPQQPQKPQPAPAQPIQTPNIESLNYHLSETKRIDELSKTFTNSPDTTKIVEANDAIQKIEEELKTNPKGAAGVIRQQLANAAGAQRLTEVNLPLYSGSTDLLSKSQRALAAYTSGKLSSADATDYAALADTLKRANQALLNQKADAYAQSIAGPHADPTSIANLKTRLMGSVGGSLPHAGATMRWNPKTGQVEPY